MYGNVRQSNIQNTQGIASVEEKGQAAQNMTNPTNKNKLLEADGGAYRSYCFNIVNRK